MNKGLVVASFWRSKLLVFEAARGAVFLGCAAITAALPAAGCRMTFRAFEPETYAGPRALPPELAAAFAYEPAEVRVEDLGRPDETERSDEQRLERGWEVRGIRFHFPEPVAGKDVPTEGEYYRSLRAGEGRAPCVIVIPILGGHYGISRRISRNLAAAGFHCFTPFRENEEAIEDSWDLGTMDATLRATTIRLRRVVDWLSARPEVDPERIAVLGVSLGGIRAVILSAVEPRIRASVFMLAGGDLASVLRRSEEKEPRLWWYEEKRRSGLDDAGLEARIREAWIADPVKLASSVDARRSLQFITTWDDSVPTPCQERLWEALGKPEAWTLPTGHYSAWFYLGRAERIAAEWLGKQLGNESSR